ncbi:hypothetical protein FJTKL_13132 [Diaporthe vaccinii]|uniref:Protein kinase domain-containing protein n=1 Tax=Diaporthe vaccinii TaxID=105482 RepID=A0ABR4EBB9_9PEZI
MSNAEVSPLQAPPAPLAHISTPATAKMVQLPVVDSTHPYNDRGDYVPEDDEGDVTDFTEGVDGYAVRGGHPGPPCYPVTVGEVIQGGGKSYRIEHKLGHGSFSTIWLAYEIGTNTSGPHFGLSYTTALIHRGTRHG